jgi:hypothetical protein
MSQKFGYRQRLVLRDLFRKGPRTTDQLAFWWDCAGKQSPQRPEDRCLECNGTGPGFNCAAHATARHALHQLAQEGLIGNKAGDLSSSHGRRQKWWALTPRGEQIAGRIDDELGQRPAELLMLQDQV